MQPKENSPSRDSYWLYEFDIGHKFGPASEEDCQEYSKALQNGARFITRGYHGYELRFIVKKH